MSPDRENTLLHQIEKKINKMMSQNLADELEKKIILMEQELMYKRALLNETRKKLDFEISEHAKTKSTVNGHLNENKELRLQVEVCLTGTKKLEEENKKNRDDCVRLQVQMNAYSNERQQLLDKCYDTEKENGALKNETEQLKEQLKGHLAFINNITQRKTKTEALVSEIITKQEMLNKEQIRLEAICKEGLNFAEKLSEEAQFQARFIREAKTGQMLLEKEILRLMVAVRSLKGEMEKRKSENVRSEGFDYLEDWKSQQKEMKIRNEELQAVNQRLTEELSFTKEQVEILMKGYSKGIPSNDD